MPAVDVGIVRTLGSPDGRAILRGLPAYDEREVMRLQDRLRKEGHAPDFVAALLTQQRLRARAVARVLLNRACSGPLRSSIGKRRASASASGGWGAGPAGERGRAHVPSGLRVCVFAAE